MADFKENGVGSRAWYIKVIKANPERSGFSFIRNENIDGYKGSYPDLKNHIEELTSAGYLQKQGRDDSPRVKYIVTSFGHRYLEQHKDELEGGEPEPKYEKREDGYYYRDGKMISRLMVPKHILDKLDGHVDGPVRVVKPAAEPGERPIDRVAKAGITLGQEIEKHNAAKTSPVPEQRPEPTNGPEIETPVETSPPHHDSKSDEPTAPKNANSDNLRDQIYDAMGRLLLTKFKKKEGMTSFVNIGVHELLDFLESES